MVAQHVGAVPVRNQQREALDDRRLAHARLTDQHRIVLLAPGEDFHHALDFLGATDRGIKLALGGEHRQVATEVIECGRLGFLLRLRRDGLRAAGGLGTTLLALRQVAAKQAQRFGPGLFQRNAGVGEHLCRDAFFLTQQPEQQMLRADVGVIQLARFHHRQLEHLLRA